MRGFMRVALGAVLLAASAIGPAVAGAASPAFADGYLKLNGEQQYQRFGGSLASSDMNGDGIDDLIVGHGSPLYDQNDFSPRSVFVLLGGSNTGSLGSDDLTNADGFRITGAENEIYLGNSVSSAGDFNGDGYGDVLISSSKTSVFKGAYVVYGSASPSDVDLTNLGSRGLVMDLPSGEFRVLVAGGGDVNGDGLDDVVVFSSSVTYIVFGGASGPEVDLTEDPSTYGARLTGVDTRSIAVGDVNGDGLADIVAGSDGVGKLHVVYGKRGLAGAMDISTMSSTTGFTLNAGFIHSLVATGDLNGDGLDDIIAAGTGFSFEAGDHRHQVVLFKGSVPAPSAAWGHLIAADDPNWNINAIASGDWNGDGREDVGVGISLALNEAGGVWILPGAASMGTVFLDQPGGWTRIDGDEPYQRIGQALVFGNFDGDGKGDIAIGAPDAGSGDDQVAPWGRVSLVENPAADSSPPLVFKPSATIVDGKGLTASPTIRLSWPAARDSGGVVRYILQLKRNSGRWTRVTLSHPLARHVDLALVSKNSNYRARLRAVDRAGHKSAWVLGTPFGIRLAQENNAQVSYSGSFLRVAQSGASGGYTKNSSAPGDTVSFQAYAFSVGFVTTMGPGMGMVRITIDGAPYGDVDLYSPTLKQAWISFSTPLAANSHTVTIEVLSSANPASSGHQVRVDAFVFLN